MPVDLNGGHGGKVQHLLEVDAAGEGLAGGFCAGADPAPTLEGDGIVVLVHEGNGVQESDRVGLLRAVHGKAEGVGRQGHGADRLAGFGGDAAVEDLSLDCGGPGQFVGILEQIAFQREQEFLSVPALGGTLKIGEVAPSCGERDHTAGGPRKGHGE